MNENQENNFFAADELLYITPWVFFAAMAIGQVFSAILWGFDGKFCVTGIVEVLTLLGIPFAFRRHEKNVMKCLIGAILMFELLDAINAVFLGTGDTMFFVLSVLYLIFVAILFGNHLLLASDHKAKPSVVAVSQVAALFMLLSETCCEVITLLEVTSNFGLNLLFSVVNIIGFVSFALIVVCVETKVNAFKQERQSAARE